jgi:uncharacterized membrane protein
MPYFSLYAGSIAPPEIAEGWAKLVPDAPERLLRMTEKEAEHRHWLDKSYVWYRMLAQLGTLILGALILVGGIYLIATDKSVSGFVLILVELVALVTVVLVRQFVVDRTGNSNGDNGSAKGDGAQT